MKICKVYILKYCGDIAKYTYTYIGHMTELIRVDCLRQQGLYVVWEGVQGRLLGGGGRGGREGQVGGVIEGRGVARAGARVRGGGWWWWGGGVRGWWWWGVRGGRWVPGFWHWRFVLRGRGGGVSVTMGVTAWRHITAVIWVILHGQGHSLGAVHLEMLPQAGGVGVGLVTAPHSAVVRLVRGVNVHVLLTITRVGKSAITTLHLALKRLFS